MTNNNDMISQAMGILGGSKKETAPQKAQVASEAGKSLPKPWLLKETPQAHTAAPTHRQADTVRPTQEITSKVSRAERIVVKELARYAALHSSILEMKYEMELGGNIALIEQRLDETLKNAKVVIK